MSKHIHVFRNGAIFIQNIPVIISQNFFHRNTSAPKWQIQTIVSYFKGALM